MLIKKLNLFILGLFITLLCACDVIMIKRIDLKKPKNESKINLYEKQKKIIIDRIDAFALSNNIECKPNAALIRYCEKKPRTLIAFNSESSFTVCLFMLGTEFDKSDFSSFSNSFEKSLIEILPRESLIISLPNELPECNWREH